MMLTCREMTQVLADYLDGSMPAEDRLVLDHHLDACPSCGAFLRTYEATIRLTGTMPCEEMPEDLKVRLAIFALRAATG